MRPILLALLLAGLLVLTTGTTARAQAVPADREVVPAPVDEVELQDAGGVYSLRVVSGLPNGCHRFHEARAERDGTCILVTVTNTRPTDPDVVCTMIYGTHTSDIALGEVLEPGRAYTVLINGKKALEFTAE